ncbi:MAG: M48 family metallopeptidase [Clostridium sp.]|nr:M48 family metallopeptidase [Clostridium sp.]
MKKFLGLLLCFILSVCSSYAASYNTTTNWFDSKNVSHLNTIGQNIVKANKMPATVTFKVTDNENMNTESTYTQVVYIYSGDLKYVENDNELAAVVAHEIGHLVNGHTAKSSILNNAISSFNPTTSTEKGAATVSLLKTISSNKVAKENDKEADLTAVDLMMTAKYNPLALISVVYKSDAAVQGGILDDNLSCEERIMNIYDYANYNYPAQVKANYKTDSYQKALNLIYANLKIRNASASKTAKAKKEQEKLQAQKLKRVRNMAKSTNPWSSAYSLIQVSGN